MPPTLGGGDLDLPLSVRPSVRPSVRKCLFFVRQRWKSVGHPCPVDTFVVLPILDIKNVY